MPIIIPHFTLFNYAIYNVHGHHRKKKQNLLYSRYHNLYCKYKTIKTIKSSLSLKRIASTYLKSIKMIKVFKNTYLLIKVHYPLIVNLLIFFRYR